MRKLMVMLAVAAAIQFAGALVSSADAATWSNASRLKAAAENFSPIQKVYCVKPGNKCTPGYYWGCWNGVCKCRPC